MHSPRVCSVHCCPWKVSRSPEPRSIQVLAYARSTRVLPLALLSPGLCGCSDAGIPCHVLCAVPHAECVVARQHAAVQWWDGLCDVSSCGCGQLLLGGWLNGSGSGCRLRLGRPHDAWQRGCICGSIKLCTQAEAHAVQGELMGWGWGGVGCSGGQVGGGIRWLSLQQAQLWRIADSVHAYGCLLLCCRSEIQRVYIRDR